MSIEESVRIATSSDREAALKAIIPQIEAFHALGGGDVEFLGPGYQLETKALAGPNEVHFAIRYGVGQMGASAPIVMSGVINPPEPGNYGSVHVSTWMRDGKHEGWERWLFEGSWQTEHFKQVRN